MTKTRLIALMGASTLGLLMTANAVRPHDLVPSSSEAIVERR